MRVKQREAGLELLRIYVLAGMVRKMELKYKSWQPAAIATILVTLNALFYITMVRYNNVALIDITFNYINPFVILTAISLILVFKVPLFCQHLYINVLCLLLDLRALLPTFCMASPTTSGEFLRAEFWQSIQQPTM